jgi:predicted transcriptional regulator
MLVNRVGSIVVIEDNGDYAGMLTERMMLPEEVVVPFMRGSAFKLLGHEVGDFENLEETMEEVRMAFIGDVMSTDNPVAKPDTHIADLTELMVTRNCHHICVLEGKKPVGMVSRHDLLRLFLKADGDPVRRPQ